MSTKRRQRQLAAMKVRRAKKNSPAGLQRSPPGQWSRVVHKGTAPFRVIRSIDVPACPCRSERNRPEKKGYDSGPMAGRAWVWSWSSSGRHGGSIWGATGDGKVNALPDPGRGGSSGSERGHQLWPGRSRNGDGSGLPGNRHRRKCRSRSRLKCRPRRTN